MLQGPTSWQDTIKGWKAAQTTENLPSRQQMIRAVARTIQILDTKIKQHADAIDNLYGKHRMDSKNQDIVDAILVLQKEMAKLYAAKQSLTKHRLVLAKDSVKFNVVQQQPNMPAPAVAPTPIIQKPSWMQAIKQKIVLAAAAAGVPWVEEDHKRDHGKFAKKDGGDDKKDDDKRDDGLPINMGKPNADVTQNDLNTVNSLWKDLGAQAGGIKSITFNTSGGYGDSYGTHGLGHRMEINLHRIKNMAGDDTKKFMDFTKQVLSHELAHSRFPESEDTSVKQYVDKAFDIGPINGYTQEHYDGVVTHNNALLLLENNYTKKDVEKKISGLEKTIQQHNDESSKTKNHDRKMELFQKSKELESVVKQFKESSDLAFEYSPFTEGQNEEQRRVDYMPRLKHRRDELKYTFANEFHSTVYEIESVDKYPVSPFSKSEYQQAKILTESMFPHKSNPHAAMSASSGSVPSKKISLAAAGAGKTISENDFKYGVMKKGNKVGMKAASTKPDWKDAIKSWKKPGDSADSK